ncbi:hypothetical protein SAMN04488065_1728 [Haloplanus vescus]|uniref:Uncharacterized protein n=1 Tax=Haloplanus vescus TaxID=555874 RepID=A0A1H3Y8E9_9EURY|nr:hypothetical protein [Haloplanus vescus]SEA07967.1 hypothetical protein SAMN04488065_1728 [Haloplanus vescus]
MSTPHPTHTQTDRTATEPTLTDGRWRADPPAAPDSAVHDAPRQFSLSTQRLYNLIDDENRAMLD